MRSAVAPLFGRFQVLDELGSGSYGRVVRAFDLATHSEVALKILHRLGADPLARFKNEFRMLTDVVHPNIVRLGELFEHDHAWAFSMELVRGEDFLSWVCPSADSFIEERLRSTLAQLVSALEALHRARLVHRDIKPDNVRVTPEGRVVVLDFGLVAARHHDARTTGRQAVGTAGYMAPELATGEPATEKADLYALGVMLYRALTGSFPYEGDFYQIAMLQRAQPVVRPALLVPSVPADLDALCSALLALDPEARPSAEALRASLGAAALPLSFGAQPSTRNELFVGRDGELSELAEAFERATQHGLETIVLCGESGMGKSALSVQFSRNVRRQVSGAWIACSRCHVSEHVSYNAFDGIVDDLARLLATLPAAELATLLPERAFVLPALFPALGAVRAMGRAATAEAWADVERIHLFDALLSLLANIARRHPMLIAIDDLQWADADSMQLLKSMLDRGPELRLLLVLTARSDTRDESAGPELQAFLGDSRVRTIGVSALADPQARALCAKLLALRPDNEHVTQLLQESAGSPLFLIELAHARAAGDPSLTLEAALRLRVAQLDPVARRCLELLTVAGAPIPQGVLAAAAGVSIDALYRALAVLRRERLLRVVPSGQLLCYHDRIREAVAQPLAEPAVKAAHAALAGAFEQPPFEAPLRAAQHWLLAGEEVRAARWLELAASHAQQSAVYEQATELYRQRLSLSSAPLTESDKRELQLKLADALSCAGHCSESARVLLAALGDAGREERRELRLRAAQQLLQAGELDLGMETAAHAMEQVALPWHTRPGTTLAYLALHRFQIRVRRIRQSKSTRPDDPLAEKQLDTLFRLTQPLAWSDLLRSMEISARALRIALDDSVSAYLPSCLAAEAVQATFRNPDGEQGRLLLQEARGWLSSSEGSSRERAYCAWASGVTAMVRTQYAEAEKQLREAERIYRVECSGEAWMQVNTRGMLLSALLWRGEHREFKSRAEGWVREAHAKGDAYALAFYAVGGHAALRHVMSDAPETALAEVERVMQPWRATTWGVHHLLQAKTSHDILSYFGDDRVYAWWSRDAKVPPLAPAYFSEGFAWRRAEATFRAGLVRRNQALIKRADRMLHPLARAATPYVRVYSGLTAMQVAIFEGRKADARKIAGAIRADVLAQDDFRTFGYDLLSQWLHSEGQDDLAIWARGHAWFAEHGWANPERALQWMLPLYPWLKNQGRGSH
ncbi:MAG: Serine/threonine-protein kinase PknA [Myxococcaceae bacterium]|nr:Serine/threonine-protein kinase PknA [Myxococcaceae bacterium]